MDIERIQAVRAATGASLADCRRALEQAGQDVEQATVIARQLAETQAAGEAKVEAELQRSRESMVGPRGHLRRRAVASTSPAPLPEPEETIGTLAALDAWASTVRSPDGHGKSWSTWQLLPIDLPVDDLAEMSVEDMLYGATSTWPALAVPRVEPNAAGEHRLTVVNEQGAVAEVLVAGVLAETLVSLPAPLKALYLRLLASPFPSPDALAAPACEALGLVGGVTEEWTDACADLIGGLDDPSALFGPNAPPAPEGSVGVDPQSFWHRFLSYRVLFELNHRYDYADLFAGMAPIIETSERCATGGTQRTELILVDFQAAAFATVAGPDGRRALEGRDLETPTAAFFYYG